MDSFFATGGSGDGAGDAIPQLTTQETSDAGNVTGNIAALFAHGRVDGRGTRGRAARQGTLCSVEYGLSRSQEAG
jgi:hypothetical protein